MPECDQARDDDKGPGVDLNRNFDYEFDKNPKIETGCKYMLYTPGLLNKCGMGHCNNT